MLRVLLISVLLSSIANPLAAQKEYFDIASFIPPKGWQRIDSNGVLIFHDYQTKNNLTSFCQIILFPSRASNNNAETNFNEDWRNRITIPTGSTVQPVVTNAKTPDGWTIVTGNAVIAKNGVTYSCVLVTISGFGKMMSIQINMAGQEQMAEMQNFLGSLDLDKNKTVTPNSTGGPFNWDNYSFIVPERWYVQKTKDYINLAQSQQEQGCLITILPPQPASGNLEADARNIFNQMYPGWKFRYTGEKHHDISKGYTQQGYEYVMMEAPMHKMRPDGYYYDYEDGAVWVINTGKQNVIVAGRHNRLIACFCNHQYEYWRRFFNSFTIKDQPPPKPMSDDVSKRIIGDWMAIGSGALTEYIFAANGNYQFIGAYGTTSRTSREYYDILEIKTSGFKGDGSYSVKGNQLTFKSYNEKPEQVQFRFEKVNHGDTGWKDRLYMLKTSAADGKLYEVCYEKQIR